MDYQKFGNTYVVHLAPGEEIVQKILILAATEKITLAHLTGLGAASHVSIKARVADTKQYYSHSYNTDLEIVSLTGNLTLKDNRPHAHVHLSVADTVGHVYGGHLIKAVVSSSCEIFVTVIDGVVERKVNPELGMNLMKLGQ